MGSVIFIKNLAKQIKATQNDEGNSDQNPIVNYYRDLLSDKHWQSLESRFVKDYCI